MNKTTTESSLQVSASRIRSLKIMADRLRRHSLTSTSEAGSGHPTSCLSCAELISTLFFHFLRFDLTDPRNPDNDRFVLSKGHAAPILWAVLAEGGAFPVERLKTLRQFDSDLEGHPTPRNPFVDVATGSLGQGLSLGLGMALASRLDGRSNHIYVLQGDGETLEGSVWEAAALAGHQELGNLILVVDVNRLGQSDPTMFGHHLTRYEEKFQAFGWNTAVIDGHSVEEIIQALLQAHQDSRHPTAVIARTYKGKGVSFLEDADGWHGKPVTDSAQLKQALQEIGDHLQLEEDLKIARPKSVPGTATAAALGRMAPPEYSQGEKVATRAAFGRGLKKLAAVDPRVVAWDGDVKNSTYTEAFAKEFPQRFFEAYIAEQNMVGAAAGMSAVGKIPFAATFACFLTRAYDFIRMASISRSNLKLCGSHAGVSIGEDGPSQMALEDLAMMRAVQGSTVLYPGDAVSAERLVEQAATTEGIVYIRTSRPATPVLYSNDEAFPVGGCKVLKTSSHDQAAVVSAGVTLHEALKAHELLSRQGINIRVIDLYSVKPVDVETLRQAARETGCVVTVEDHYPEGGLGEAVQSALSGIDCKFHKLAVNGLPRSGKPEELLDHFQISARSIADQVSRLIS